VPLGANGSQADVISVNGEFLGNGLQEILRELRPINGYFL
jgi:hypothetical protein